VDKIGRFDRFAEDKQEWEITYLHIVMIFMLQLDKYYNIIISFFMGTNFSVFLTF